MKNKYCWLIIPVTLLIVTGCASNQKKEPVNCGQVNNGALAGFKSMKISPKDQETVNSILSFYNTPKAWTSECGGYVIAVPGQAAFNAEQNAYCRNISLHVDLAKDNIYACISKDGQPSDIASELKWKVISSNLKQDLSTK